MPLSLTRRDFGIGTLFAGLALTMAPRAARARTQVATWFSVLPEVEKSWIIQEDAANPLTVRITPRLELKTRRLRTMVVYPRASSAYDTAISKMLEVFESKGKNVELEIINFRNDDALGRAALERADQQQFDLIIAMGSESTAWLWKAYQGGRVPVVTVCSKDPVLLGQAANYEQGSGTNFAFTSLNMQLDAQMAYVNELRPNLKNIAVMVDGTNVSAVQTQAQPIADYARARGIRVIDIVVKDPANAKAELGPMVREAVAAMTRNDPSLQNSLFWITGSTSVFKEIDTINANSSRVPVVSAVTEVVQAGDSSATLSIGIGFESNAHLAAIYASDVLDKRAKAGDLKVGVVSPPDIAINFRKARDIGFKVPFSFFESATNIYDYSGQLVRADGASILVGN